MQNKYNHLSHQMCNYLDSFEIHEDDLQRRMRLQAVEDGLDHWLIPAEVGRFFYLLTKISGAKRIYEIGSYLGYSATWWAKALPEDGQVVLTDKNDLRHNQAVKFLESTDLWHKVVLRKCDALEDLGNDSNLYDIILIDHDKPDYCDAFRIAKKKIKPGGLIVADNVLWRGRIVDQKWQDDPSTQGILEFNEMIMTDPDVVSSIVPIGDGVSLSYLV